jgi:hypothetical protein
MAVLRELLGLLGCNAMRSELVERDVSGKQLPDDVACHVQFLHRGSDGLPDWRIALRLGYMATSGPFGCCSDRGHTRPGQMALPDVR